MDDAAGDGGARVGLEDDGVAECERRCDRADAQDDRDVERRDDPDDADRQPAGHRQARLLAGQQLAVRPAGQRGGLVALLLGDVQREPGHRRDRADLADVPPRDLVGVLGPQLRRPCAAPLRAAGCGVAAQSRCASRGALGGLGDVVRRWPGRPAPSTAPVAGSDRRRAVPPDAATHAPPMKIRFFHVAWSRNMRAPLRIGCALTVGPTRIATFVHSQPNVSDYSERLSSWPVPVAEWSRCPRRCAAAGPPSRRTTDSTEAFQTVRWMAMLTAATTRAGPVAHRCRHRAQPGREFLVVDGDPGVAHPRQRGHQLLASGDGLRPAPGQVGPVEQRPQRARLAVGEQDLAHRGAVRRQPRADVQVQSHREGAAPRPLRRRST